MTDWGSVYGGGGSSSSSGGGWAGTYGGSSGGGIAAGAFHGGGGGGGGLLGLVENLGSDAWSTIHNAPRGFISLGHQVAHTLGPSGVTENIFAKNPTGVHWLDSILNAGRDEHKRNFMQDRAGLGGATIAPFIKQERHIYGSALHGNFHPLYEHPLQPILDAATVASLGGVGALKLAEAGKLGQTAADVARAERVLKSGDLEQPLNQARTLQGRYLQRQFDRLSMQPEGEGFRIHENTPLIGANPRLARISEVRKYRDMIRATLPVREFQRLTAPLRKDEKFAYHVAAEGVPLDERIAFYRRQMTDTPSVQLNDYLHRLESPGVRRALENPRPEFTAALHEGHSLQEKATQRLVDAGQLTREAHDIRSVLPQRIMSGGAEYAYPETLRHVPVDEHLSARQAAYRDVADAKSRVNRAQAAFRRIAKPADNALEGKIKALEDQRVALNRQLIDAHGPIDEHQLPKAPESTVGREGALQSIQRDIARNEQSLGRLYRRRNARQGPEYQAALEEHAAAREAHQAAQENLRGIPAPPKAEKIQTSGEFVGAGPENYLGQPNRVHPDFPQAFRWPYIGEEAGKPGLFTSPANAAGLRPPKTPGFLRHTKGLRVRTARMATNPEVLSRDYLAGNRHVFLQEFRRDVLRPASRKLDASLARTGFKRPGEHYFFERQADRVPRHVSQQEALSRDLGAVDAKGHELTGAANEHVFSSVRDAPPEVRKAIEAGDFKRLEEMGVRRLPEAFAKRYGSNFAGTGKVLRLFWDKPMDVWRAITLNLRPAWMVNNLVGNAAQYALRYAGVDGAEAYLRALLATERGEDKVLQLRNYTMRIPTLRRKYGRIFNELMPEIHGTGLYSTMTKQTHGGVYQSTIDAAGAQKVARAISTPAKVVKTALTAIPKGITAFERHIAEAVPREAAMMNELRPVITKLGLAHQSWEDALRAIVKGDAENATHHVQLAEDRMLDYLGDFNATSAAERRVIKRFIPFEAWYRVIVQVTAKFALHYPARVNLIRQIGLSYEKDNQSLPSWLKGAIPLGPIKGDVQPMLTTMGLNPYETIPQLATQNPAGSLAFPIQGAITGVTGVDPFTTGAYRGIGASKGYDPLSVLRRSAGSAFEGFVPTRLYGQTVNKPTNYLYQPKTYGHLGPVAVNDALLQYLGLPIRHVRRSVAKTYAAEGR